MMNHQHAVGNRAVLFVIGAVLAGMLALSSGGFAGDLYMFGGGGGAGVQTGVGGAGGGAYIGMEMGKAGDGAAATGTSAGAGVPGTGAGSSGPHNAGDGDGATGNGGAGYNDLGYGTAEDGRSVVAGLSGRYGGNASVADSGNVYYDVIMLGGGEGGGGAQSTASGSGSGGSGGNIDYNAADVTVGTLDIAGGDVMQPSDAGYPAGGRGGDASFSASTITLLGDATVASGKNTHLSVVGGNANFSANQLTIAGNGAQNVTITRQTGEILFTAHTLELQNSLTLTLKDTAAASVAIDNLIFKNASAFTVVGTGLTLAGNVDVHGKGNVYDAGVAYDASGAGRTLSFDFAGVVVANDATDVMLSAAGGAGFTVDDDTSVTILNTNSLSSLNLGGKFILIDKVNGTTAALPALADIVDGDVAHGLAANAGTDDLYLFKTRIQTDGDYEIAAGAYSAGTGANESITLDVGGKLTLSGAGGLGMISTAANGANLKAGVLSVSALDLTDANNNLFADIGVLDVSAGDMTVTLLGTAAGDGVSGVRFGGFRFGAGNTLAISGTGQSTRKGPIEVLGAGARYSGPAIDASGESLTFSLSPNLADGSVMLYADNAVNVAGATVVLQDSQGPLNNLRDGDMVVLIDKTSGTVSNEGAVIKTLLFDYDFLVSTAAAGYADQLTAQFQARTSSETSNAFAEGYLSKSVMINHGGDLVAGEALRRARDVGTNVYGWTPFAAISGEFMRYKTGSHIDVDGFSYLAGLSWSNMARGGMLTFGAFFEGGHGNYDTRNSFAGLPSTRGKGDVDYYGGGILSRLDLPGGLYAEGSARVGRVESDFDSSDLSAIFGQDASYTSGTAYYGAHFGLGYAFTVAGKVGMDFTSRYLWTRQAKDSLDIAGTTVDIRAVDSHRWRNGVRVSYAASSRLAPYVGAAFEYEFGGKAKSCAAGFDLAEPALRGGSGMGELGVTYCRPDGTGICVDAGIQGYVGKREGFAGRVQVGWRF